jgi:competence ComEA-like helix-hairpin-helix protein
METPLNLNTASKEDLTNLPDIGPTTAERIIAARPFETVEAVNRVNGIGPATLERISPLVTVAAAVDQEEDTEETAPSAEGELAPDEGETDSLEEEPAPEPEPSPNVSIIPFDEKKEETAPSKEGISLRQVVLIAAASGFFAFVLAVALTLGLLAGINGGLQFASPAQVQALNRQVDGISAQADILSQDVEGLRTRIGNLEGFGDRVDQLETDLDEIAAQTDSLASDIESLQSATEQHQHFFEGLNDLLDSLFESETP